ncbi:unnamed protein product [Boreogadus saida]
MANRPTHQSGSPTRDAPRCPVEPTRGRLRPPTAGPAPNTPRSPSTEGTCAEPAEQEPPYHHKSRTPAIKPNTLPQLGVNHRIRPPEGQTEKTKCCGSLPCTQCPVQARAARLRGGTNAHHRQPCPTAPQPALMGRRATPVPPHNGLEADGPEDSRKATCANSGGRAASKGEHAKPPPTNGHSDAAGPRPPKQEAPRQSATRSDLAAPASWGPLPRADKSGRERPGPDGRARRARPRWGIETTPRRIPGATGRAAGTGEQTGEAPPTRSAGAEAAEKNRGEHKTGANTTKVR